MSKDFSDAAISSALESLVPHSSRGISRRSVQRWRLDRGLTRRTTLPMAQVKDAVRGAVGHLGPNCGRRFVKGFFRLNPITEGVSEKRISSALKQCFPGNLSQRAEGAQRNLNPVPYIAEYFGHKLHMDQNEKLANFGVTHVAAIDGFSGMVVSHATMPIKNNITIYDRVFRPELVHYGMWDHVVVDQGREFYLTLSAQTYLGAYRTNPARAPYIQIPSTKNNRIERVWVEVNRDVNFPVKRALETMVDDGRIIPSDPTHLFATSRCGCSVTTAGLARLLAVRNARHCRGFR